MFYNTPSDTKHAPNSNNNNVKGIIVARSILPAIGWFCLISLTDKNVVEASAILYKACGFVIKSVMDKLDILEADF